MKFGVALILILLVASGIIAFLRNTEAGENDFHSTAAKLSEDKQTRVEKVIALHAFVRDEIREVKAQYR